MSGWEGRKAAAAAPAVVAKKGEGGGKACKRGREGKREQERKVRGVGGAEREQQPFPKRERDKGKV